MLIPPGIPPIHPAILVGRGFYSSFLQRRKTFFCFYYHPHGLIFGGQLLCIDTMKAANDELSKSCSSETR
jgi:hypothetical protein